MTDATPHILAFACDDRPGLVAAVTGELAAAGGNITDARQYNDPDTARFFMRVAFDIADGAAFRARVAELADGLGLDWRMRRADRRPRVLILVSKFDHCLVDLLYRHRAGELAMDVVGVVSNHPREALGGLGLGEPGLGGIPFHHLPVTRDTKPAQEARLEALIDETGAELVVLARYMQILSDRLAARLSGRCVNIHHSFLPSFKGARPYHQAHARGVKMIGATAHFVTADLDEGPIIAQGAEPVTHAATPADLVAHGRSIEQRVLARAVRALVEDRVFLNGRRTVVF